MRDKIINGMNNDEMRKSVIVKDKLTCEELIRICRSEDIINDQSTSLRNKEVKEINYVGNHKKKLQEHTHSKDRKYRYCGKAREYKKELCTLYIVHCTAYGKTCIKCGRKNHFKSMCKSDTVKVEKVQSVYHIRGKCKEKNSLDHLQK